MRKYLPLICCLYFTMFCGPNDVKAQYFPGIAAHRFLTFGPIHYTIHFDSTRNEDPLAPSQYIMLRTDTGAQRIGLKTGRIYLWPSHHHTKYTEVFTPGKFPEYDARLLYLCPPPYFKIHSSFARLNDSAFSSNRWARIVYTDYERNYNYLRVSTDTINQQAQYTDFIHFEGCFRRRLAEQGDAVLFDNFFPVRGRDLYGGKMFLQYGTNRVRVYARINLAYHQNASQVKRHVLKFIRHHYDPNIKRSDFTDEKDMFRYIVTKAAAISQPEDTIAHFRGLFDTTYGARKRAIIWQMHFHSNCSRSTILQMLQRENIFTQMDTGNVAGVYGLFTLMQKDIDPAVNPVRYSDVPLKYAHAYGPVIGTASVEFKDDGYTVTIRDIGFVFIAAHKGGLYSAPSYLDDDFLKAHWSFSFQQQDAPLLENVFTRFFQPPANGGPAPGK